MVACYACMRRILDLFLSTKSAIAATVVHSGVMPVGG